MMNCFTFSQKFYQPVREPVHRCIFLLFLGELYYCFQLFKNLNLFCFTFFFNRSRWKRYKRGIGWKCNTVQSLVSTNLADAVQLFIYNICSLWFQFCITSLRDHQQQRIQRTININSSSFSFNKCKFSY